LNKKIKGNPLRVIKSALSSSGIFEKSEEKEIFENDLKKEKSNQKQNNVKKEMIDLEDSDNETKSLDNEWKSEVRNSKPLIWTVKPKEAVQYLSRTIEKFQMKIIEKEKKMEEKQHIMLGTKTR
jgi:hypothetical protein